jgi:membrane-associated phospholipid phosphatase
VKRAAHVISILFHPVLMTTYLFILFAVFVPGWFLPLRPSVTFIFLIFALTFILPVLNFILFKVKGTIRDFNLTNARDRRLPFVMVSLLYIGITGMFYWKFPVPNILKLLLIVNILMIVATTITFFYKISIHSVGMWALAGIFLYLGKAMNASIFVYLLAALVLLCGVVMSSRLLLNAHTPREVLVGSTVGLLIGFAGMVFLY